MKATIVVLLLVVLIVSTSCRSITWLDDDSYRLERPHVVVRSRRFSGNHSPARLMCCALQGGACCENLYKRRPQES